MYLIQVDRVNNNRKNKLQSFYQDYKIIIVFQQGNQALEKRKTKKYQDSEKNALSYITEQRSKISQS